MCLTLQELMMMTSSCIMQVPRPANLIQVFLMLVCPSASPVRVPQASSFCYLLLVQLSRLSLSELTPLLGILPDFQIMRFSTNQESAILVSGHYLHHFDVLICILLLLSEGRATAACEPPNKVSLLLSPISKGPLFLPSLSRSFTLIFYLTPLSLSLCLSLS